MYQCHKCGFTANFRMTPKECPKCCAVRPKHPLWVRLLQRLSTPEDIGLGATAKRLVSKFGGERFIAWRKSIGMPCKCGAREAEWNKLYPNPNYQRSDVGL